MTTGQLRVLVCGNPDLNYIDGSSVWSQTIALVIAETRLATVDFLARSTPVRDELFQPLQRHSHVRVLDGTSQFDGGDAVTRLTPVAMAEVAGNLDRTVGYDLVVVRGRSIALEISENASLLSKCWLYLTDIPQSIESCDSTWREQAKRLAAGCDRILCQSQGFVRLWKSLVPGISDEKIRVYTPVVYDLPEIVPKLTQRECVAVYAGKFAPDWMTLDMAECWTKIRNRVSGATLKMIGDKIHQDDTNFAGRMHSALNRTEGIEWHGAMSREATQARLLEARVGLSWRSANLNDTLEYSTKLLEYGGAGCAVVLNRNSLHEELLGEDYPLFANRCREFLDAVEAGLSNDDLAQFAADRLRCAARLHQFSAMVSQFKEWLTPYLKKRPEISRAGIEKICVLVAGHDLKFFEPLQRRLEKTGKFKFLIDKWYGHDRHDESKSRELLRQADVILCEWCLGNLEWYSRNILPHQRLVARLHGQERNLPYLDRCDWTAIELVVFVSDFLRRQTADRRGLPVSKLNVIPNYIDEKKNKYLKKTGDAHRTLGLLGMVPSLKGLDRAVDLLECLLDVGEDFQLRVKGRSPANYPWLMRRETEVAYYQSVFNRINASSHLLHRVIFDPAGQDVHEWFSLIGYVLSPSTFESFHMAVGEGIVAGCEPLIWSREGAKEIWGEKHVVEDTKDAVDRVLAGFNPPGVLPSHLRSSIVLESWQKVLSGEPI